MGAPKSNAGLISDIVRAEAQRLYDKSCGKACTACGRPEGLGLADEDLQRLERLTKVSKYLVTPATAIEKAQFDSQKLVAELKAKRDPLLFPRHGVKSPTSDAAMARVVTKG